MKPAESAKPAESEKIPDQPAKDAKISLCSQKKDLIIFTTICLSCSLFVMIGFYTFFPNDKQPIKLSTNQPISMTNGKTNATTDDEDDIDYGCPYMSILGDGYCDDEANIAECLYDSGDCCYYENDRTLCEDCFCYVDQKKMEDITEGLCNNPVHLIVKLRLGDGYCDLPYNRPEFNFDQGDCCLGHTYCWIHYEDTRPWTEDPIRIEPVLCPPDVCIESNAYCVNDQLGDGTCQDHNNGPLCDYDHGDCCLADKRSKDTCYCCNTSCLCHFPDYMSLVAALLAPLPEKSPPPPDNCSEIELNFPAIEWDLPHQFRPSTLDVEDVPILQR